MDPKRKIIAVLFIIMFFLLPACSDDGTTENPHPLDKDDDDSNDDASDDDISDDDDDNDTVDDDDDDDNDDNDDFTPPPTRAILSVEVEDYNTYNLTNRFFPAWTGDLWPSAWGDDDKLYISNGDGFGFGRMFSDIVFNIVEGMPPALEGSSPPGALGPFIAGKWGPNSWEYSRKPTGLACVDGDIYIFYQNLANVLTGDAFSNAPHASISMTPDKGETWVWDASEPMFTDHVFTTGFFLDFGKCSRYAVDGYQYVYGLDYNWRFADGFDQTLMYLARVPHDSIPDRDSWEFFTGVSKGEPTWSANIDDKTPVLEDDTSYTRGYSGVAQGSVVYLHQFDRYLYSTRAVYEWIFWEAPAPWGPWTRITVREWTGGWDETFYAGYNAVIPTKYLDQDGQGGWIISSLSDSWFNGEFYSMGMRRFTLEVEL